MVVIVFALADRCSTLSYTSGLFLNAMRSLANLVIILFTTSPINHRISKSGFCQSVNQSIKLPPVNEFLIWVLGAIYVNFGPMGWGEGSFKDDAMCTQLTVDGETA